MIREGVENGGHEVTAQQQFDPGGELETLAILGGLGFLALLRHTILGRAHEGALDSEQRFHDGLGIGDGEADAERHEERQIVEGLLPALGIELALAHDVKDRDGEGGCGKEGHVDEQHLEPAHIEAADHGRHQQRRHDDHERITEIGREVVNSLDLVARGCVGVEDLGQNLDAGLDESLGPARLLGFEGGHLDGQLGGAFHLGQVFKLPAGHLRSVAEVGVFSERVVLPATAVGDGLTTPHAGGAVEVEVLAGAGAGAVFQHKMPVEQDGLNPGQHAVFAIEVRPAGLHHADLGLSEVMDDLHDPVRRRHEVGIEDGDELAFGDLEAGIERTSLEAVTVGAVDVDDGCPKSGVAVDDGGGNIRGFIGGVVENLDFELFARVLHGADGLDKAVDDELLVKDGQLDSDARQLSELPGRVGIVVLPVLEVLVTHGVTVNAIEGKQNHHREVGQQHAGVEDIPVVMHRGERVAEHHPQLAAQKALGRKKKDLPEQPPERAGSSKQGRGEPGDQR